MSRMQDVLGELQRLGAVGKPAAPPPPKQEVVAPPPEPPPDLGVETDTSDAEEAIAALTEGFRAPEPEPEPVYAPEPVETALEPEEDVEDAEDDEEAAPEPPEPDEDGMAEALATLKVRLYALETAMAEAKEQVTLIRRMLK